MAQILVRSPEELKTILTNEAKRIGISTNALILQILGEWKKEWLRENQPSRHEEERRNDKGHSTNE